jgi:hypothetical protein
MMKVDFQTGMTFEILWGNGIFSPRRIIGTPLKVSCFIPKYPTLFSIDRFIIIPPLPLGRHFSYAGPSHNGLDNASLSQQTELTLFRPM